MAYCQKHNIEYEDVLSAGAVTLRVMCPKCREEKDAEIEGQAEREAARVLALRFAEMNIEPSFFGAELGNFIAATPELIKAVTSIKELVAGKINQIVMTGKNGTGKTHLAVAAVKALNGKIFSMYEISTRIRASYTARALETELEIVDELARLPMLTIDELGRTKGSDAETNWLSYIIDKRHARNLPTIIISNKHVQKDCPAHGCENCLENYISEDIMSRLSEGGILLRFTGEDWRKRQDKKASRFQVIKTS